MKHLVIPDVQFRSGDDPGFLSHIAKYICEKKPDKIIQIGDFADMPSLSTYDIGKKSFEGRRYKADIEAANEAIQVLTTPIWEESNRTKKAKKKYWQPELHITLGNHEDRISRVCNSDPKLDGTLSLNDLDFTRWGWTVHQYLQPVVLDGVCYAHYFTSGVLGRPVTSARQLLIKKHMSCVMGHVQNWEMSRDVKGDGTPIVGLFCGACYEHNEDYLGPQGNNYSRGIWMLHEVENGDFQPMYISLKYLKEKYG